MSIPLPYRKCSEREREVARGVDVKKHENGERIEERDKYGAEERNCSKQGHHFLFILFISHL